jgi:hypothetical protein
MLKSIRVAAVAVSLVLAAGCAARVGVGYRVYDPYYRDYHFWDNNEAVFYNRWTVETHHDPHRDFRKLNHRDQQDYWRWRHDHDRH